MASDDEAAEKQAAEDARVALRDLLGRSEQLIAILKKLDADGSGQIDKKELYTGVCQLGYEATEQTVSEIFDELDKDESGSLGIGELKRLAPNEVKGRDGATRQSTGHKGALPTVKLDEYRTDKSISEQLRDFLQINKGRVVDLFRAWDDDGGGTISKAEFRKAMAQLGVTAHKNVVDTMFDTFDVDGSGAIEYSELDKLLKGKADIWLNHSLEPQKAPKVPILRMRHSGKGSKAARQSRIGDMCDKLGYPEFMSIDEYLRSQHRNSSRYTTVPEARVEYLLHRMLPIPDPEGQRASPRTKPKASKAPEEDAPIQRPFNPGYSGQPKPPKALVPIGPRVQIDLGPPALRWKEQVQEHWTVWQRQQQAADREDAVQFYSRRPWHAQSYTVPGESLLSKPNQTELNRRWHEKQLRRAAGSPLKNAEEDRETLLDIWPRQQLPSATKHSLREALSTHSSPDPERKSKGKRVQIATGVATAAEQTAVHDSLAPAALPVPSALLAARARFARAEPLLPVPPSTLSVPSSPRSRGMAPPSVMVPLSSQSARPHYQASSANIHKPPFTSIGAARPKMKLDGDRARPTPA